MYGIPFGFQFRRLRDPDLDRRFALVHGDLGSSAGMIPGEVPIQFKPASLGVLL